MVRGHNAASKRGVTGFVGGRLGMDRNAGNQKTKHTAQQRWCRADGEDSFGFEILSDHECHRSLKESVWRESSIRHPVGIAPDKMRIPGEKYGFRQVAGMATCCGQ